MNDAMLKKVCLLTENKSKIEGLKSVYTSDEISAALAGTINAYSSALAVLLIEREQIYAMSDT